MMVNSYQFPDGVPEEVMLSEGCGVILKNGDEIYVDSIPDDKRHLVDHINPIISSLTVSSVKNLMRKYGGYGWTEHYERDGSLFETSEIHLTGNNSRFKYNRHL